MKKITKKQRKHEAAESPAYEREEEKLMRKYAPKKLKKQAVDKYKKSKKK